MRVILLSIILCVIPTPVLACFSPTGELAGDHAWLIKETPTIIYAKAKSIKEIKHVKHATKPAKYIFKIISILKGSVSDNFLVVDGDSDLSGLWDTTFSNHTENRFWSGKEGWLGNIGDCRTTPPPGFILGQNYLLFLGGPDDSKKYERIDTEDDKWLNFVKSQLR